MEPLGVLNLSSPFDIIDIRLQQITKLIAAATTAKKKSNPTRQTLKLEYQTDKVKTKENECEKKRRQNKEKHFFLLSWSNDLYILSFSVEEKKMRDKVMSSHSQNEDSHCSFGEHRKKIMEINIIELRNTIIPIPFTV